MAISIDRRERARPSLNLAALHRPQLLPWLGLAAVLVLSACLNLLRIGREGYVNSYYAAAIKSMAQSWHNFFFVSFDPGGFVSVDKPPLGFWVQTASVKLFCFHGWSLLLPEALAGVGSVVIVFLLVRRVFGSVAGLLAALVLALTPITVATSRNNTIDTLLVFTLLLGTAAILSAAESGRLRWLLLAMALVGLGFNIKTLEAFLVLPAFIALYFLAAPVARWTRLWQLALAGIVLIVISLSWMMAVDLTPASQRPYVGSSQHNSELELALGYNGIERLLGHSNGSPNNNATTPAQPAATTSNAVTATSGSTST
jgi:4-amino-4-deoxy-L-arabinose transferase-like glycosyltransferase